jgi:hypothetical protein
VAEGEGKSGRTHGKYLYSFWRKIPLKRFKETVLHAEQPCINAEYGGGCSQRANIVPIHFASLGFRQGQGYFAALLRVKVKRSGVENWSEQSESALE